MSSEIIANDLRRFAIQTRTEITYRVRQGGETCVVNTQGLIKIPGLSGLPSYNVEEVLARADQFELQRAAEKPRTLTRDEMVALLKATLKASAAAPKEE